MPLYLNERQIGFEPKTLGFPTIGSCMGVAVQDISGLFGFHVMPGDAEMSAQFVSYIHNNRNYTGNLTHLYGCSRWAKRYSANGRSQWEAEMRSIAQALNYSGPVTGFDASDGTKLGDDSVYIEFRVQSMSSVTFHYKRTPKVTGAPDYTVRTSPTDDFREIQRDSKAMETAKKANPDKEIGRMFKLSSNLTRGMTPSMSLTKKTKGNKGDFHAVGPKKIISFQV